ncbi:MAG: hypothetical protein K6C10_04150, partial [Prevotella sp.]|nr:hypothetical protein [Prevotella sp.]
DGCLEIKTKGYKPQVVKSKGIIYLPPLGIANVGQPYKESRQAEPTALGTYLKLEDQISAMGVRSKGEIVTIGE